MATKPKTATEKKAEAKAAGTLITARAFKFAAYPTKEQAAAMEGLLETHRRLYNGGLAERRDVYREEGRTVNFFEQSKKLTVDRKTNPHLAVANAASCHRTLRRLQRTFDAYFRRMKEYKALYGQWLARGKKAAEPKKPGYPRFRGYGRFDSVDFTAPSPTCDGVEHLAWGIVRFTGVGEVKIKQHRAIEGTVKTISFKREGDRWFVVFSCQIEQPMPEPSTNPTVGIDLGLKSFLATSEGEAVAAPQFYRKAQKKRTRANRQASRKQKGSKNQNKAYQKVRRIERKVANQRRDFHYKLALDLVRRFGKIAHEDLNIEGIVRSRLAKSTHDAGWGQFLTILSHKAECAGVQLVAVDPRNTTQTCSQCGGLPAVKIGLSVRTYTCAHCGHVADRDHNAAVNIKERAFPST